MSAASSLESASVSDAVRARLFVAVVLAFVMSFLAIVAAQFSCSQRITLVIEIDPVGLWQRVLFWAGVNHLGGLLEQISARLSVREASHSGTTFTTKIASEVHHADPDSSDNCTLKHEPTCRRRIGTHGAIWQSQT